MPIQAARTVSAQNQWTTPIGINGWFNVSISNTAGGTLGGTIVTIQRSWDGVNYYDVDTWKKTSEDVGFEPDLVWYTIGVKTGQYVASVYVQISVLGSMRSQSWRLSNKQSYPFQALCNRQFRSERCA